MTIFMQSTNVYYNSIPYTFKHILFTQIHAKECRKRNTNM